MDYEPNTKKFHAGYISVFFYMIFLTASWIRENLTCCILKSRKAGLKSEFFGLMFLRFLMEIWSCCYACVNAAGHAVINRINLILILCLILLACKETKAIFDHQSDVATFLLYPNFVGADFLVSHARSLTLRWYCRWWGSEPFKGDLFDYTYLLKFVMIDNILICWTTLCEGIQLVHMQHIAPQIC